MKKLDGKGSIKIVIISCLHGNEVFGKAVFDYFRERIEKYPELRLILANEKAFKRGVRYIDKDLNTAFPGNKSGNHEERLASKLAPLVGDVDVILDIHTTSSEIEMVPIVCSLDDGVRRILRATRRTNIAFMKGELARPSLIGNVSYGVSLEFGEDYVNKEAALKEVVDLVDCLTNDTRMQPTSRRVFEFTDTIPLDLVLDKPTKNFQKQPTHGFYPFLFDEKSNEKDQGFAARIYRKHLI